MGDDSVTIKCSYNQAFTKLKTNVIPHHNSRGFISPSLPRSFIDPGTEALPGNEVIKHAYTQPVLDRKIWKRSLKYVFMSYAIVIF